MSSKDGVDVRVAHGRGAHLRTPGLMHLWAPPPRMRLFQSISIHDLMDGLIAFMNSSEAHPVEPQQWQSSRIEFTQLGVDTSASGSSTFSVALLFLFPSVERLFMTLADSEWSIFPVHSVPTSAKRGHSTGSLLTTDGTDRFPQFNPV
ncbi:hypothetical protein EDB83DRAFT_2515873 [Lactarius deliciosus]|nr:hypothetical protein EDB83DRAFT_2515873 [Lactarius deliciosus]